MKIVKPVAVILLNLFLHSLLAGCSLPEADLPEHIRNLEHLTVYPADTEPAYAISLEPEASYGDTEEVMLGPLIMDIAVDERGRVYMADYRQSTIQVFNPDGSYLQSIGRKGRGPGEFQMLWMLRLSDKHLLALDYLQEKISVFDLNTLDHETDIDMSVDDTDDDKPSWLDLTRDKGFYYRATNFYPRPDGSYLVFFSDEDYRSPKNFEGRTYEASVFSPEKKRYTEHDLLSFPWTGRIITNDQKVIIGNVPFIRSSQFDYFNGRLVYGWTNELLFKWYDTSGGYQRAFYHSYDKPELKRDDILELYKDRGKDTKDAILEQMPENWPAFNTIVLDDQNRLWVSVFIDDIDVYDWRILDEQGRLLGTFTWPRNRKLMEVKGGYAYTLERDKETGLQRVVRYRVEMN